MWWWGLNFSLLHLPKQAPYTAELSYLPQELHFNQRRKTAESREEPAICGKINLLSTSGWINYWYQEELSKCDKILSGFLDWTLEHKELRKN